MISQGAEEDIEGKIHFLSAASTNLEKCGGEILSKSRDLFMVLCTQPIVSCSHSWSLVSQNMWGPIPQLLLVQVF